MRKDLRKGRKEKTSMTLNTLNGLKNLTAKDAGIYAKVAKKNFNDLKCLKWFEKFNRKGRKDLNKQY